MLTLECGVTLPGVCEDGRSSDYVVRESVLLEGVLLHQPGGSPDGPERRRRRPTVQVEGQATQEEFSSPMQSRNFISQGVQGLYQLNSHSKLCRPGLSGGSDGGGLGAPPGYADFVTSAVRSAMEPFLQNMAQVVGEQTAQITVVNQRVEQVGFSSVTDESQLLLECSGCWF